MMIKKIALVCSTSILLLACGKRDSHLTSSIEPSICVKAPCFFSISTENVGGNLAGISGADALCQAKDARAKAFLVDGTHRAADVLNQKDWVLKPNTTYFQLDGTKIIGKTNAAAVFDFPLNANFTIQPAGYWTGLNDKWETDNNCNEWTNNESPAFVDYEATFGSPNWINNKALKMWSASCSSIEMNILCVSH